MEKSVEIMKTFLSTTPKIMYRFIWWRNCVKYFYIPMEICLHMVKKIRWWNDFQFSWSKCNKIEELEVGVRHLDTIIPEIRSNFVDVRETEKFPRKRKMVDWPFLSVFWMRLIYFSLKSYSFTSFLGEIPYHRVQ